MWAKLFVVVVALCAVAECHHVQQSDSGSLIRSTKHKESSTLPINLLFSSAIKPKARIHDTLRLRPRRQLPYGNERQGRGWGWPQRNERERSSNDESSNIHRANWDNIHVISFNRNHPTSNDRDSNGYQPPNRDQNYGDSDDTNRRTDSRHGFTSSIERHYVSNHELEYSDHDIDGGRSSGPSSPQLLPQPESPLYQQSPIPYDRYY